MNNNLKTFATKIILDVCKKMAFEVSASACGFGAYQPKEPKCLTKPKDISHC